MLNTSNISEEALNDDESAESPSGSAEVLPDAGELELIRSEQVMSLTWASIWEWFFVWEIFSLD